MLLSDIDSLQLKIISEVWLLPKDLKHFSPMGRECGDRNVTWVSTKLHEIPCADTEGFATSQRGWASA